MNYKGKTVRVNGIEGVVIAETISEIKIQTTTGVEVVSKINNVITIVTLAIKLAELINILFKKIKAGFKNL